MTNSSADALYLLNRAHRSGTLPGGQGSSSPNHPTRCDRIPVAGRTATRRPRGPQGRTLQDKHATPGRIHTTQGHSLDCKYHSRHNVLCTEREPLQSKLVPKLTPARTRLCMGRIPVLRASATDELLRETERKEAKYANGAAANLWFKNPCPPTVLPPDPASHHSYPLWQQLAGRTPVANLPTPPCEIHSPIPPHLTPLYDIPSGCCFFTGPWTVTRSSLRMLCRVAAFCRPLRPVLLLVSFPRSRSPVVGVLGLC